MTNPLKRPIESIDQTTLTPLVRQTLQDETATILGWSDQALEGGFSGATVHRFQGEAQTATGRHPWSLVRKSLNPASGGAAVDDFDYWKREVLVYQSGLLDRLPTGLVAPRCFDIEEYVAQHFWLWLEDMGSQENETQWPLEQYGIAARHLGHFNGAYLTGQPLPTARWMRKPDVRDRLDRAAPGIDQLAILSTNPHFATLLPADHVARIQQLWADRRRLLAALDQLPQTFCHRDAFQRNLLMRTDPHGAPTTVALDWGSCGLGMLGEELLPLFSATLIFVRADTDRLAELDQTIFSGYIAGLRAAGWHGDEQLVRFGFTALTALKFGVADPATKLPNVARRIAALPPGVEAPRLLNPGGVEQAVVVSRYELGLGDEARALLHKIETV